MQRYQVLDQIDPPGGEVARPARDRRGPNAIPDVGDSASVRGWRSSVNPAKPTPIRSAHSGHYSALAAGAGENGPGGGYRLRVKTGRRRARQPPCRVRVASATTRETSCVQWNSRRRCSRSGRDGAGYAKDCPGSTQFSTTIPSPRSGGGVTRRILRPGSGRQGHP